jgi:hypothetical protein
MAERVLEMARYTGGCLCGALRWEATADPLYAGHCYCADCRKASGSGFIPFMAFSGAAMTISGKTLTHRLPLGGGRVATRNSCAACGGLVFGGEVGESTDFNIYAGSLDDPTQFHPKIAIFTRNRPAWALVPQNLKQFETMPSQEQNERPG